MMVVVSYDVSTVSPEGRRRLRRVARICVNHGQRVQNSVFQCLLAADQWTVLRAKLLKTFDPREDSLRFYFLGNNWKTRVEHQGAKKVIDLDDPLIA